jgi:hypothetical protein
MAGLAKKAGRRAGLLAKPGQARRPWGWPHVARANKIKGEVRGAKIQKGFEKDHCHCHADERVDLVDLDLRTGHAVKPSINGEEARRCVWRIVGVRVVLPPRHDGEVEGVVVKDDAIFWNSASVAAHTILPKIRPTRPWSGRACSGNWPGPARPCRHPCLDGAISIPHTRTTVAVAAAQCACSCMGQFITSGVPGGCSQYSGEIRLHMTQFAKCFH